MSVFLIRGDEVIITRYDEEINFAKNKMGVHDLKSPGKWIDKYNKKDENAIPNTTRYASSRKVTATSDVEVAPPRYSPVEDEDVEDTTAPTTTTTTKQSASTTSTTGVDTPTTTTSAASTTDAAEETTATSTTVMHECVMPEEGEEESLPITLPQSSPWIAIFGIVGGAILVVGGVVLWIMLGRRK